jgi:hypothetical protein
MIDRFITAYLLVSSISAIFRTRTTSTIYKIQIEKRERWANRGMAFVCHWKYMDFGEDNKKMSFAAATMRLLFC